MVIKKAFCKQLTFNCMFAIFLKIHIEIAYDS